VQQTEPSGHQKVTRRDRSKKRQKSKKRGKSNAGPVYKPVPPLTRSSLEPTREKIKKFIQSLSQDKKLDHKFVMKVKGKCLNSFLGIIRSDLPRLAVEGFP